MTQNTQKICNVTNNHTSNESKRETSSATPLPSPRKKSRVIYERRKLIKNFARSRMKIFSKIRGHVKKPRITQLTIFVSYFASSHKYATVISRPSKGEFRTDHYQGQLQKEVDSKTAKFMLGVLARRGCAILQGVLLTSFLSRASLIPRLSRVRFQRKAMFLELVVKSAQTGILVRAGCCLV